MEDQGLVFERYDEDITARMPSEEEARLLELPAGAPVLHLVRTAVASGRAVEVCDTVMDAAAFVLAYRLPA
jgi:GntR family transcriptional regulator